MVRSSVQKAFARLATRFSGSSVDAVARLDANESKLCEKYRSFAHWPSDAQLALHLDAWLIGPGFHNGPLRAHVNQLVPDFAGAARVCRIADRGHPGIVAINSLCRDLLETAQRVLIEELDPWPVYGPSSGSAGRASHKMW